MAKPEDCQTAAMTMVQIAKSPSISQSNRKEVQPRPLTSFWMPMPGLRSQLQTVPVTTKETARG
jgi:hypothetical protein